MNECGVVNTDCYDTANRRIEEKGTKDRLGIIVDNCLSRPTSVAASPVGKTARVTCRKLATTGKVLDLTISPWTKVSGAGRLPPRDGKYGRRAPPCRRFRRFSDTKSS